MVRTRKNLKVCTFYMKMHFFIIFVTLLNTALFQEDWI